MKLTDVATASPAAVSDELAQWLNKLRPGVLRPAQGSLKHPYLVPGAYTQAWDWDSYFIGLALADWPEAQPYLRGTVENFFANMDDQGRMPRWLHPEQSFWDSSYVGTDFGNDLAKPFFAQLALVYSQATGDYAWFKPYIEPQRKFLDFWRKERMGDHGLHVWAHGLESGGDNNLACFGWPTFTVEGVDLAVFLIREYLSAAILAQKCGDHSTFQYFWGVARFLEHQMAALLFDPEEGRFFNRFRPTGARIRVDSAPNFYALWLGSWLTTDHAARRRLIERHLLDPEALCGPHGFRSLSKKDPGFNSSHGTAPSNCQGPIWLMVNHILLSILVDNGYQKEAAEIGSRVQRLLLRDLLQNGAMTECYHSETGEPLAVPGFLSWNLLAAFFVSDAEKGRMRGMLPLELIPR
jgi:neutral trehalase